MNQEKQLSNYELGLAYMPADLPGKHALVLHLIPKVASMPLKSVLNGCLDRLSRRMPLTAHQISSIGLCLRICGAKG